MKLTWFGGTTLRVYIGGEIVVVDADTAPPGIDHGELLAGAGKSIRLADPGLEPVDADIWRPRSALRPIDPPRPVEHRSVGPSTLLIDAPGEPPLLILDTLDLPHFGRWVDGAVLVLVGRHAARLAVNIIEADLARPRLLAVGADEAALDLALEAIGDRLYEMNVSLASLEPGLALEV